MSNLDMIVGASADRVVEYDGRWRRAARRRGRWGAGPIDFAFDFSGSRLAMHLSPEEAALVDLHRAMSPADRQALMHIAQSMAERAEAKAAAKPKGFRPGGNGGGGQ